MYPAELRYTRTHEWVRVEGGIATVGITAYAVEQLRDVVFLELPSGGGKVTRGSSFGVIESVKAVFELNSPVSGKATDVNKELSDQLELLKTDPYGEGWMLKVELSDPSETDSLMDSAAYEEYVKKQEGEE